MNPAQYIEGKPCRRGHTMKFARRPGRCVECKHLTDAKRREKLRREKKSAPSINRLLYGQWPLQETANG